VPDLEATLEVKEDEFKEKFGICKPKQIELIVTHCFVGGRAQKAAEALRNKGFINTQSYPGSFKDWIAKEGKVKEVKQ
jgi:rhodanese-related sulfurtransferase